jgi:Big-like domain-containing protein
MRRLFSSASLALATMLLASCGDNPLPPGQDYGTLIVRADLSASAVATLVADVTAPDIPTGMTFNIPIVAGVASGAITVPAGSNRTVALRAYDAGGIETHTGSVTLSIQAGTNPTVAITLQPLIGDQPLVLTLGSFTVNVTPPSPSVRIAGTVQLVVTITDWNGTPTTGVVRWATKNPGVATVDTTTGLVTGTGVGNTKVAATFHGATGTATIDVTP